MDLRQRLLLADSKEAFKNLLMEQTQILAQEQLKHTESLSSFEMSRRESAKVIKDIAFNVIFFKYVSGISMEFSAALVFLWYKSQR